VTFDRLDFIYTSAANASDDLYVNLIKGSTDLIFTGCFFEGDIAHGTSAWVGGGTGQCLAIRENCKRILVEKCRIHRFKRAVVPSVSSDLTFRDNEMWHQSSDGFTCGQVTNILIERNVIRDQWRVGNTGYHSDLIQCFTRSQPGPTTNVTIRNNLLMGTIYPTQGIFMRNESVDSYGGGEAMLYRNILVENNVLYIAHYHGVTIGEADGVVAKNNTVFRTMGSDPKYPCPINVKPGGRNVQIRDNIAGDFPTATHFVYSGNVEKRNGNGQLLPYLKNPEVDPTKAVKEDFRRLTPAGCDIDLLPAYG
jgi:hypothetical protein